ncbi:MAG: beta-ribofuranosylaminobenzene 5'-phosphate synthase, partial [Burkholderiales bacterium]|nr:beta-ribofuranosylaminobenzene 5'-phosphate synthase [Burkholderiales bacterium]
PLIARIDPPAAWRVIVALDRQRRGLAGAEEKGAIERLAPLVRPAAAEICHEVLMRVLPGAAADDFEAFAAGINRVQILLGEHFAPAQGGSAWTSPVVGRLMQWLRGQAGDAAAVGQSSWGPTGFAIVPSAAAASGWIDAARAAAMVDPELELRVVAPRTRGAVLGLVEPR